MPEETKDGEREMRDKTVASRFSPYFFSFT